MHLGVYWGLVWVHDDPAGLGVHQPKEDATNLQEKPDDRFRYNWPQCQSPFGHMLIYW